MIKFFIDHQVTRNKYRVRMDKGGKEVFARYCSSRTEAERARAWGRKIVNALSLEPRGE